MVSEIQPGQTFSRRPPAHPDTMGENNTPTALKGCGVKTRGMLLLTKAKRPLKFEMLCGFNKHAVKLRMHKPAPYAFQYLLIHYEAIKATIKEV